MHILFTFILMSLSSAAFAKTFTIPDYPYPIVSPSIASLTSQALPSCALSYQKIKLSGGFTVYLSKTLQPSGKALLLMTGLGGDQKSPLSEFLTCEANSKGHHVFVIPNSFTVKYARQVSAQGLPGQPKVDSGEVYELVYELYKSSEFSTLGISDTKLLGYSHGGLLAWHVFNFDRSEGFRLFSEALLLNPPVDLLYGIRVLDRKAQLASPDPLKGLKFLRRTKRLRKQLASEQNPERFYWSYQTQMRMDEKLADRYLGAGFKSYLSPVITEVLERYSHPDFPPLPPRASVTYRYALRQRQKKISAMGFEDYLNQFVMPIMYGQARVQVEDLNSNNSLFDYETELRLNKRVRIITNSDDFLLAPGHSRWIQSALTDRAVVFPRGGHLGNLLFPKNRIALADWLSTGRLSHEL